eukprot:910252-Pyramimonas_sp.AAC.1
MDHCLAMDDLSRGLHDETARATFRDRATDFIAAQGAHDKSAIHPHGEKLECCYTDGARGFAGACIELKIAHDATIPGNKKLIAVAERSNGI